MNIEKIETNTSKFSPQEVKRIIDGYLDSSYIPSWGCDELCAAISDAHQNDTLIELPIPAKEDRLNYLTSCDNKPTLQWSKEEISTGYLQQDINYSGRKYPKGQKIFKSMNAYYGEWLVDAATMPIVLHRIVLTNRLDLMVEAFTEVSTCFSPGGDNQNSALIEMTRDNAMMCIGYRDGKPVTRCLIRVAGGCFAVFKSYSNYGTPKTNMAGAAAFTYLTSLDKRPRRADSAAWDYSGLYTEESETQGPCLIETPQFLLRNCFYQCEGCDVYVACKNDLDGDGYCRDCVYEDDEDCRPRCEECGNDIMEWETYYVARDDSCICSNCADENTFRYCTKVIPE